MPRIVEVKALPGGLHRSQTYHGEVMDGYALIPADMETPNFPYGEVEASKINGIMTVTKWTPGEVPALPTPAPSKQREEAYNTQAIVDWEGSKITVTQAAQLWQYYAAEGSEKAAQLQALIAVAKEAIRLEYPDEEVSVE